MVQVNVVVSEELVRNSVDPPIAFITVESDDVVMVEPYPSFVVYGSVLVGEHSEVEDEINDVKSVLFELSRRDVVMAIRQIKSVFVSVI